MRTPLQQCNVEPFVLPSNLILFHDWRYINHGYPGWKDPQGQPVPMFHPEDLPPIHYERGDGPYGLRLRALEACKKPAFLSAGGMGGIIFGPTVIHEDGRYRLWYGTLSGIEKDLLCYAESDDSITWRHGAFTKVLDNGKPSSVVFGGEMAGPRGFHGPGVFRDPIASPAERYKVIYLAKVPAEEFYALAAKYPDLSAPSHAWEEFAYVACGAVSPNGLDWTPLDEPISLHFSDTHNTAYYDTQLHRYVWFCRTWVMGRRSIGRSVTDDFRHFPPPETILWPGADVPATSTWYGNGKTLYPGTVDYHLLLPWRWHVGDDCFYTHLFTSPDAILWTAPPENLILPPGERGQWDCGGAISGCGMVELPGDEVGVPYVGYRVPHKYPRKPPLGEFAWATWQRDRLVGLEADEIGEFHTWVLGYKGDELRLNVQTKWSGTVRVGVLDDKRMPIPGRGLDDCDAIDGDHLAKVVTWRGDSRIRPEGQGPCAFHVRMEHAKLFSMRFA